MKKTFKKTILIDLDGVLNQYTGDFDPNVIPPMKQGAGEFLQILVENHEIKLFTTRNKILASKWLIENGLDGLVADVTNIKEVCWLFIDDRSISFDGDFKKTIAEIEKFRPWYK